MPLQGQRECFTGRTSVPKMCVVFSTETCDLLSVPSKKKSVTPSCIGTILLVAPSLVLWIYSVSIVHALWMGQTVLLISSWALQETSDLHSSSALVAIRWWPISSHTVSRSLADWLSCSPASDRFPAKREKPSSFPRLWLHACSFCSFRGSRLWLHACSFCSVGK